MTWPVKLDIPLAWSIHSSTLLTLEVALELQVGIIEYVFVLDNHVVVLWFDILDINPSNHNVCILKTAPNIDILSLLLYLSNVCRKGGCCIVLTDDYWSLLTWQLLLKDVLDPLLCCPKSLLPASLSRKTRGIIPEWNCLLRCCLCQWGSDELSESLHWTGRYVFGHHNLHSLIVEHKRCNKRLVCAWIVTKG